MAVVAIANRQQYAGGGGGGGGGSGGILSRKFLRILTEVAFGDKILSKSIARVWYYTSIVWISQKVGTHTHTPYITQTCIWFQMQPK